MVDQLLVERVVDENSKSLSEIVDFTGLNGRLKGECHNMYEHVYPRVPIGVAGQVRSDKFELLLISTGSSLLEDFEIYRETAGIHEHFDGFAGYVCAHVP